MLTMLANSTRSVLQPNDDYLRRHNPARQPNLGTAATVGLIIAGIIVVPMVLVAVAGVIGLRAVSNAANEHAQI